MLSHVDVDVLVVDDDPDIRDLLQAALQDEGYRVGTAADGHQALARIAGSHPSLVLLDLRMPVMDGCEVERRVEEWGLAVAVVFMSAEQSLKADAQACRVAGYLPKPFDLAQVLDVVERFTPSPQS